MRIKVVIGILLGFAVIGVLVLAVVIKTFDLNDYRDEITAQVREATGRELTLRGELELGIALNPRIAISGASFANAAWGSQPEMLTVGRAEVRLALWPLVRGDVQVRRVALRDVELLLEMDAQGRGNWTLGPDADADADAEATGVAPGGRRDLGIDRVDIEDFSFTWREAKSGDSARVRFERLTLFPPDAGQPFVRIALVGDINEQALNVSGTLTPIRDILRGEPLVADLHLETDGASVEIDGTVREPMEAQGVDLQISGTGDNLKGVLGLAGLSMDKSEPWRLSFGFADGDGDWLIKDLKLQLGESDLAGRLRLEEKVDRLRIEGELSAGMLDLDRFTATPEQTVARPAGPRGRVFSAEPLALDALKSFDADLALNVETLKRGGLTFRPLSAKLQLEQGMLTLTPVNGGIEGGTLKGRMVLDAGKRIPSMEFQLDARNVQIGPVVAAALDSQLITGPADLDVDLRGQGASVAAMMASLNGHVRLLVGEGRAQIEGVDQIVGGLSQLAGQLAGKGAEQAVMKCLASDFDIRGGVAQAKVLLLDTAQSTVTGEGRVDLGSEKLDLIVKPQAKSATLNVAVPVEVGGTLAQPSFRPEKFATARKVGGLLGILVYPPAALAGLGEMAGEQHPCRGVVKAADGSDAPAEEEKSTLRKATDGVKDAVQGIGSKIKGLFGD